MRYQGKILSNQRLIALVGLIIIFLISFPLFKNLNQRRKINREIKDLQEEILSVEGQNSELGKLINYLESDEFIEEQARLNFGLKKAGEKVAVIEGSKNETASSSVGSNEANNKPPLKAVYNPERWWGHFFD